MLHSITLHGSKLVLIFQLYNFISKKKKMFKLKDQNKTTPKFMELIA